MRYAIFLLVFFVLFGEYAAAEKRILHESVYQARWCSKNGGYITRSPNNAGLYPDCVTPSHVVEFDFADKYRECLIQALEYKIDLPGKSAKCVLIEELPSRDARYIGRAKRVVREVGLPVELEVMR